MWIGWQLRLAHAPHAHRMAGVLVRPCVVSIDLVAVSLLAALGRAHLASVPDGYIPFTVETHVPVVKSLHGFGLDFLSLV